MPTVYNITDAYNTKAIAAVHKKNVSNAIPYLGEGLFPRAKKMSLDLKWIADSQGLPVSLAPSTFDSKATLRSRDGFEITQTQMAYFKEAMIVKEEDEQKIMQIQSADEPLAQEVLSNIFNDSERLIAAAQVVPERMRMSLLSSCYVDGEEVAHGPSISIAANGATYAYDYDQDGSYAANNFLPLSGTSVWSDTEHSDPIADIQTGIDAVEDITGDTPAYLLVSKQTFTYLKQNDKIKSMILAQNATANVLINDARVKEIIKSEVGVDVIVYKKKYKDEDGIVHTFYPDGMATLLPSGALGKTWFGMTPDERTGVKDPAKDVSIIDTGVAVSVVITDDPVQTKTTASEIVLPSFERMKSTYQIACYTPS